MRDRLVRAILAAGPDELRRDESLLYEAIASLPKVEDRIAVEYALFIQSGGTMVVPTTKGLELA